MPDPLLYYKAIVTAAIVSAMSVLAMAGLRRSSGTTRLNSTCVLGIGFGLSAGYHVLSLRLAWPPVNGLDRLLEIVIPVALAIELVAGLRCVPNRVASFLRLSLIAAIPRILLHRSVYLSGTDNEWTLWQVGTAMVVSSVVLAGLWSLLSWLLRRSPGVSIPFALSLSTLCAGVTVMMAGYIKGGAAAFPLAATIAATTVGAWLISKRASIPVDCGGSAILGIGVAGLFGLLFIGHFFGEVSAASALAMLLAPLLCWATEIPLLRHRKPWIVGSVRLVLVAIPLMFVLAEAKSDFDREMAPLLIQASPPRFRRPDGNAQEHWKTRRFSAVALPCFTAFPALCHGFPASFPARTQLDSDGIRSYNGSRVHRSLSRRTTSSGPQQPAH